MLFVGFLYDVGLGIGLLEEKKKVPESTFVLPPPGPPVPKKMYHPDDRPILTGFAPVEKEEEPPSPTSVEILDMPKERDRKFLLW